MVGYFTAVERECIQKGNSHTKREWETRGKRGKAIAERTIGCLRAYKICGTAERKEIFTF